MGKDILSKIRAGDLFPALERVLRDCGVVEWEVEDIRPHPAIAFDVNGWHARFHFAGTPHTRGHSVKAYAGKLRSGIQALYMQPGNGRSVTINKGTASDVANGVFDQPASQPVVSSPFRFEGCAVRAFETGGGAWFVAKDVAGALGYRNARDAVISHCTAAQPVGESGFATPFDLDPQTTIIPERDVYRLVMRSHLESARRFEEWVVAEVLPMIRKTGSYVAPGAAQAVDYGRIAEIASRAAADTVARILPEMMAHIMPRHPVETGLTAGEVISLAGIADHSGIRGAINAVSASLCEIHRQRGVTVHVLRHGTSSRKLFDPSVCRDWLATGGRDFIRRRVQESRGQGAMVLALADHRELAS